LSTFDAWFEFARRVQQEGHCWLERLEQIEAADVRAILDRVPPDRMSSICRRFTIDLLMENQHHLLDRRTP